MHLLPLRIIPIVWSEYETLQVIKTIGKKGTCIGTFAHQQEEHNTNNYKPVKNLSFQLNLALKYEKEQHKFPFKKLRENDSQAIVEQDRWTIWSARKQEK